LATLLLPVLVLAAYAPGLRNSFTGWDDYEYIRDNPLLHLHDGLRRIWLTAEAPQYYPLTFTTHWLEYRLWRTHPTGYFAVNVALHAASAVLALLVARALGLGFAGAWLAAALFSLHPVQVGTVAWLAERKNVLSTFFQLMTLLLYVWHRRHDRWGPYVAALLTFALAVLSKTVAVTLLPVLWLTDRLILHKSWWRGQWRLLPMLLLALLPTVVTAHREHALTGAHLPAALRPLQAAGALWFYVYKFIWPATLLPVYPRWTVSAASAVWWFAMGGALLVVVGLGRLRRWVPRTVIWGLTFFLVSLAPALGFVTFGFMTHAAVGDHLAYIAIFGLALTVAAAIEDLRSRLRRRVWPTAVSAIAALAVVGLSIKTAAQVPVWRSAETLWSHTLRHNPSCDDALIGLGSLRRERGDLVGARDYFARALSIRPDSAHAHVNMGVVLAESGQLASAVQHYKRAIALHSELGPAHSNLAAALLDLGWLDEAIEHGRAAVRYAPNDAAARMNLGSALAAAGRPGEALEHLEFATHCEPHNAEAHNRVAQACLMLGRVDQAVACYRRALRLKPDHVAALTNLGVLLAQRAEHGEAIQLLRRALELDPGNRTAREVLAGLQPDR